MSRPLRQRLLMATRRVLRTSVGAVPGRAGGCTVRTMRCPARRRISLRQLRMRMLLPSLVRPSLLLQLWRFGAAASNVAARRRGDTGLAALARLRAAQLCVRV